MSLSTLCFISEFKCCILVDISVAASFSTAANYVL